ncbi:MAG: glycosyltransferase family 10 [Simkaniaceae bacterium]|nr:glycosyltransferase family 10 [Candidatus Sacchlamyda saccharinae]
MRKILLAILLSSLLHAKSEVHIIRNGVGPIIYYQNLAKDLPINIIDCTLDHDIKRGRTLKGKLIEKISLPTKLDKKIEKFIFMNIPQGANKKYHLEKLPKEKMVLFMWEPPIRLRKMYSEGIQKCFSKIYTFNDDLVDNKTYFKFYYPSRRPMLTDLPSFAEKDFITLICGATTDKSRRHPNELYSERIKAIRFFEANEPTFAFYGINWNPAQYPSYRGPIDDKLEVNKRYKFSICYENCQNLPGYITEKIFDCFAAGSLPIYWGASNIQDYIPSDCYIDRRHFSTLEELYAHLKNITPEEYESYLTRIRTYLTSEKSALFSPENYVKILLKEVY